jgi:hypothetical protein
MAPGTHRVSLRRRGFADTERTIELPSEKSIDVSVRLVPARPKAEVLDTPTTEPNEPTPQQSAQDKKPPERGGIKPLTWITLGVGVAGLGAAGVFEFLRRGAESDAKNEMIQPRYIEDLDRHDDFQRNARIAVIAGGVFTLAGATLLIMDLSSGSGDDGVAAGASCLPGGCWVEERGSF